jgi:hypothetical protein
MPKPYPEDLRSRVAEAVAAGHVALKYRVSSAFVCRMHALWRETGAVQGKPFVGYRRSQLGPTLKPGDIVICGNLPAHKAAERTYDKLWQLIGKLLDKFQADECLNLFRHSGYVST